EFAASDETKYLRRPEISGGLPDAATGRRGAERGAGVWRVPLDASRAEKSSRAGSRMRLRNALRLYAPTRRGQRIRPGSLDQNARGGASRTRRSAHHLYQLRD